MLPYDFTVALLQVLATSAGRRERLSSPSFSVVFLSLGKLIYWVGLVVRRKCLELCGFRPAGHSAPICA